MEMMISAIEKFDRNLSWRAFFKLNPNLVTKSKETFGFNSTRAGPRVKELVDFERDLVRLLQNIKFRRRSKPFLASLKEAVNNINQNKLGLSCAKLRLSLTRLTMLAWLG
jgi:hypothetical protein